MGPEKKRLKTAWFVFFLFLNYYGVVFFFFFPSLVRESSGPTTQQVKRKKGRGVGRRGTKRFPAAGPPAPARTTYFRDISIARVETRRDEMSESRAKTGFFSSFFFSRFSPGILSEYSVAGET